MRMNKSMLAAGVLLGAMGTSAFAAPLTISSTVKQSGVTDLQTSGGSHVLTSGTGYNFAPQAYNTLTSIVEIVVTLSVTDGDSDIGDFDEGNLFLTLDGINTGLKLDGFTSGQIVTLTINQLAPGAGAAILAALLSDGKLVGGVFDTDADGPAGNTIGFAGAINTTLDITGQSSGGGPAGVPLPAAVVLAPLGAGLAGFCARRFRRVAK